MKARYFNGTLVEDMFYNLAPLMRKKLSALILHVDANNTVSRRSRGSPLRISLKEIYSFKENNTRIRKFKSTSWFFRQAFDINSGIHSIQQRDREFDDFNLNPLDQERKTEEQVINHNKDNTNTNKINGWNSENKSLKLVLSQIVLIITTKTLIILQMEDTDNMKEIINTNVDMESNKKIRENVEKDVRTKENVIRNVSENCKNAPLEKISEKW